jgi:hypothetical protein
MKDAINIFIQQNRPAFDTESPGTHHWKGVEKTLERLPHADALERYLLVNRILMDTEMPSETVWNGIDEHLQQVQKTDLEGFIQQNRAAFDHETPDLRVWAEISNTLPKSKPVIVAVNWKRQLLRAAASVALLVVGLSSGIWYARSQHDSGMDMADVSAEYAELEKHYERNITEQKEKLAMFTGSQSADVMQDLDQLDRIMEELRRDLANVPPGNRPQVVRAMIENYKAKTAILQRVLEHLEENQNESNNRKLSNEIKNI